MKIEEILLLLEKAFSPSAPITSKELFSGRARQLDASCGAINERGQHFVIFGDRGVGKTSLANIIEFQLSNVVVSKVTCNRTDSFKEIWEKALNKITFAQQHQGMGFRPELKTELMQLDLFLPQKAVISTLDIQHTLEKVSCNLLFLFDEFDSIISREIQSQFADTIKALSDNAPRVTIGVVGIADDVESLIGKHQSLERCLKQIEMPRMSKAELEAIVLKGLEILSMTAEAGVTNRIVELSSGFPHFTHLLGKFAARSALNKASTEIKEVDLSSAIFDAIANVNQSIKSAYRKATIATKPISKFEGLTKAAALASIDESGSFASKDLIDPFFRVTGQRVSVADLAYTLQKLCDKERGSILQKLETISGARYRFANPLMKTYVKLLIDRSGTHAAPALITSE